MSDHHHYEYAEARHDHRGDYADSRHDHDLDYAGKHHRHYDDESRVAGLREDLGHAEARIRDLEDGLRDALERIRALEQQTPDARQAEYEADTALADLAESGYSRYGDEDDPEEADGLRLRRVRCMRTIWVDGSPEQCGEPVDHEPGDECPGNPHARPAPEAGQS